MKHNILFVCLFLIAVIFAPFSAHAQPSTPQETLNQYISDLQKNPNDYALRGKIIRHVQSMKPAPVIPEEARKYVNRGVAAGEGAKTENDYLDAIAEFQKAVNIAPWIGAGYRGLAVMQDKAGQYSQALQNLKLFLLTNPSAEDAEKAKALRDGIEYRQEKAARESSPEAIAAKKQNEYEEWLRKIDGARYVKRSGAWTYTFNIRGNEVIEVDILGPNDLDEPGPRTKGTATIEGRRFTPPLRGLSKDNSYYFNWACMISEDGSTISCEGGGYPPLMYHRER